MAAECDAATPRVAILVPVHRHGVLVVEAIESALAQIAPFAIRTILVNDGCPFPETHATCRDYAVAHPHRVVYLRKPNGGLADARNFGVRHVLDRLPSVEAIYFLDADNRLRPQAVARAMAELDAHPEAAIVYPNIDMFGMGAAYDMGGDYSLLLHTAMNLCEAGSLVRREVFEAGVFFDVAFRQGWEDWDFFLSAARAGFRGRNLEHLGFRYRKRPASMLAEAERQQASLGAGLARKHAEIMGPRALVALEDVEAPRYAIHAAGAADVLWCTDPLGPAPRRICLESYDAAFWRAALSPGRHAIPPVTVVMPREVMEGLSAAGLLHFALWRLESGLEASNVSVLRVERHPERRLGFEEASDGDRGHLEAVALAISTRLLREVVRDDSTEWVDSLARAPASPTVSTTRLFLPRGGRGLGAGARRTAVYDFLAMVHRLRASPYRAAARTSWDWRAPGVPLREDARRVARQTVGGAPLFPRVAEGGRNVGFLLPLVEFGGVEKVALRMAGGLRAHDFVPHLVVTAAREGALGPEWAEVFETISFLADPAFAPWGGGESCYLGTEVPGWATLGDHRQALGLLHFLDAAIDFHCGALDGLMGELRRHGVRTAVSLHQSDLTARGRPVGNTYLGLAYEHAFDLFIPCSRTLGGWLHAMGVPADKIVPVPNAPGFPLSRGRVAEGLEQRARRPAEAPLRALYLGRLDRQKGLHRLAAAIRGTRDRGLSVEWRVIGAAVLGEAGGEVPPEVAALLEPPLTRPQELAAAYAWADVVVLLSSWEGLPLTILEAMRQGAVPIATDVGAVAEVVEDGETGFLLDLARAVPQCLDRLAVLAADRERLRRLSCAAAEARAGDDWEAATRPLAARLADPASSCLAAPPAFGAVV